MSLPSYLESRLVYEPQYQLHVQRINDERKKTWKIFTSEGTIYQFTLDKKTKTPTLEDANGKSLGTVKEKSCWRTKKYHLVLDNSTAEIQLSKRGFGSEDHKLKIKYADKIWDFEWQATIDLDDMAVIWSLTRKDTSEVIAIYRGNFNPDCNMGYIDLQENSLATEYLGTILPRVVILSLSFLARHQKQNIPF